MSPSSLESRTRRRWILFLAVLALWILLPWKLWRSMKSTPPASGPGRTRTQSPILRTIPPANVSPAPTGGSQALPPTRPQAPVFPDRSAALKSLVRWIHRREGHEVEVVDARDACDLNGKPVSMSVIVSTRLGAGLTGPGLREQLSVRASRESVLKQELRSAHQAGDIARVNQLAAQFSGLRSGFSEALGIRSYRISLLPERPPVLSYWEGLPFETARESAAAQLAADRLGGSTGLQGLVHFTSATALLHFTNATGAGIYIDPARMQEVPIASFPQARPARTGPDEVARMERIATQWSDFLLPP